jgi:hypothetical protein
MKWAAIIGLVLFGSFAFAQTPRGGESKTARPVAAAPGAQQNGAAAGKKVQVQPSLDRTAMWVGDHVVYTVEVTCPPGTDILADDLASDKLKLDGLELAGSTTESHLAADGGRVYHFRYNLTTYSVSTPDGKIGPIDFRYYMRRPGQRLEDAAPAGEIQTQATTIAIRSVLPDGQTTYPIRDDRAALARPLRYSLLQSVGIGLIVISIVPAVIFGIFVVQQILRRKAKRWHRQVRTADKTSLDVVRSTDLSTAEARRQAYAQLSSLVRDHLHQAWGINGTSLTPEEIAPALSARGARIPADLVASVLSECDRALYSPADALPSADACRQTLKSAESVLAAKR